MEIHPEDTGVIRCICGFDHDDKFTIQCEHCNVWQHAVCVDIFDEQAVPDVYHCDQCGGHQHDAVAAVERQARFLRKHRKARKSPEVEGEPRRRGRKKRVPEEDPTLEATDIPKAYFIPCKENQALPGVAEIVRETGDLAPLSQLEYSRTAPAVLSIARVREGFGIPVFSLVASVSLARGRFVTELVGELLPLEEYKRNPVNQYRLLGCPKPGVFLVPDIPLVLDSRRLGSPATFIRRSLQPNLQLSTVLVGDKVHVLAFTHSSVKAGTELTLPWEWDSEHPIHKLAAAGGELESSGLSVLEKEQLQLTLSCLQDCTMAETFAECMPSTHTDTQSKKETRVASVPPVCDPRQRLQQAYFSRRKQKKREMTLPPIDSVEVENIWVAAQDIAPAVAAPEPKKKKLSLADYKKKRPSQVSVS